MRSPLFNTELTLEEELTVRDVEKILKMYSIGMDRGMIADLAVMVHRGVTPRDVGRNMPRSVDPTWVAYLNTIATSHVGRELLEIARRSSRDVKTSTCVLLASRYVDLISRERKTVNVRGISSDVLDMVDMLLLVKKTVQYMLELRDIARMVNAVTLTTSRTCGGGMSLVLARRDVEVRLEIARQVKHLLKLLLSRGGTYGSSDAGRGSRLLVDRMRHISDVCRLHLSELCYPKPIRSIRIVTYRALAYTLTKVRTVDAVYVDTSGSTEDVLDGVRKVAINCAVALYYYQKHRCRIYPFSGDVIEISQDPQTVIETLLTAHATGGTSIYSVYEHAEKNRYKSITIVTDLEVYPSDFDHRYAKKCYTNIVAIGDVASRLVEEIRRRLGDKVDIAVVRSLRDLACIS